MLLHSDGPGVTKDSRQPASLDQQAKPYVFVDPIFEQDRLPATQMLPTSGVPSEPVRDALDATVRKPNARVEPFVSGDLEHEDRFLAALDARCEGNTCGYSDYIQ